MVLSRASRQRTGYRMYHAGHQGISLLVYSPIAYILVTAGYPVLALLGVGLMIGLASFPDIDMRIPFLDHRGFTHTIGFAALVGVVLAGIALFFGQTVVVGGVEYLTSASIIPYELTAPLSENADVLTARYGGMPLAMFTFAISILAICSHLLGDVITPMGIRPLWPLSGTHISLGITRAGNTLSNSIFLVVGWVAIIAAGAIGFGFIQP